MNYKKILIGFMSILTALTLAACGDEADTEENTENPAETETTPDETEDSEATE